SVARSSARRSVSCLRSSPDRRSAPDLRSDSPPFSRSAMPVPLLFPASAAHSYHGSAYFDEWTNVSMTRSVSRAQSSPTNGKVPISTFRRFAARPSWSRSTRSPELHSLDLVSTRVDHLVRADRAFATGSFTDCSRLKHCRSRAERFDGGCRGGEIGVAP